MKHAHGSDRVRVAGEKILLFSRISKGWQARVPATNIRGEHPGTAVLWDEQYYEVIEAGVMQGGGVRYVLAAWRDEHVFRDFQVYDDESEARIAADFEQAKRQRSVGKFVWLASMLLGHLPAPVQNRLANEYGVTAPRMTALSTIPSVVLLGVCVWLYASARLEVAASPVPGWLWAIAFGMTFDSAVRYLGYMTTNRALGSLPGTIVYAILSVVAPKRFPWPRERGNESFMIAPEEDVVLRDDLHMRAPLLTLLSPAEQRALAERYGFDYREHAYAPAVIILCGALLGVISLLPSVRGNGGVSAFLSFGVAALLTIEQIIRLYALQHRPAGSVLAPLVRPFVRRYL
ncbi:MAG TPA: hypothetical protein VKB93_05110 [Thermoanaerobaculia bacterium]|nr:hypothetical protein [Thermoanaerobaculia bacterium]